VPNLSIFNSKSKKVVTISEQEMTQSIAESTEQIQSATPPLTPNRRLKKVGWGIFGFSVVFFVVLNLVVVALEPFIYNVLSYYNQVNVAKVTLYYKNPRADVLYMGNSRVNLSLDPAMTEQLVEKEIGRKISVLNYGISSADVEISYLILKNIIARDKQPDIIIYGVSEFDLRSDVSYVKTLEYADRILPRLDDFELLAGDTLEQKASFVARQLVPLYRNHKLIKDALGRMFNPEDPNYKYYQEGIKAPPTQQKGFFSIPSNAKPNAEAKAFDKQFYGFLRTYEVGQQKITLMERLVKEAQSRGIKIVLVNMPTTPEHLSWWGSQQQLDRYLKAVSDLAARTGVPYLDLYTDKDKQFADKFYDANHLNRNGATYITETVVRNYILDYYRQK
jgi:hypothetical protein